MMRQYELVERVLEYNPSADEALLNRAYVYAMKAHGSQKRASGDPYFSHPLEVAAILTRLHLDDATIAAALLHDTVEDTETTSEEIESLFGLEVRGLVDGMTKIEKLGLVSKETAQAENLRKLLLAVTNDVRVLFIKLADRLHNMRTLQYCKPEKRVRISEETMDIYAPLAGRIGMQWMREELEDLSFREINPEGYQAIVHKLDEVSANCEGMIEAIEAEIVAKLADAGIEAKILSRRKKPYSIWNKLERKKMQFEQLSDIFGFRIIVEDIDACYRALGVVHSTWKTVPGRFKDFISTPKPNNYRSIHTTVIGPARRQRVELQIRTQQMHDIAQYGIAAHALYKDGISSQFDKNQKEGVVYDWVRRLIEVLEAGDTPEEFLESTKLELFQDQVFCFTPKGRLVPMPRRATPIDFAYAVHTDIGNSTVGCKINGITAPLTSELQNGDEVEIIRAETNVPPAAWQHIAITGKARSAIRRATRNAVRVRFEALGRQIVARAEERLSATLSEKQLEKAAKNYEKLDAEDLLISIGSGELEIDSVFKFIYPEIEAELVQVDTVDMAGQGNEAWFNLRKEFGFRFAHMQSSGSKNKNSIVGLDDNVPALFSANHGAVPGDRIVGIIEPGEGVMIYPIHSHSLRQFENFPERWLDIGWNLNDIGSRRFPVRIHVFSVNEPGVLALIAQIIAENDTNIENLSMHSSTEDFHETIIDLGVYSLKHLTTILTHLNRSPLINRAYRSEL
jgi:RelA/SpoT family (p)ppGpp synthetase